MTWWTNSNIQLKQKFRFFVEISDNLFLFNVKTVTKPSAQIETKEFQLINHKFNYPGIVTWQPIKITMVDMRGNISTFKDQDSSTDGFQTIGNSAWRETLNTARNEGKTKQFYDDKNNTPKFESAYINRKDQAFDTSALLNAMLKFSGYDVPTSKDHPISMDGKTWREISSPEKASTIANAFGKGLIGEADFDGATVGLPDSHQSIRIYQVDPDGSIVEKWTLHNPIIKSINWGDLDYASDDPIEYSLDVVYDFASLTQPKGGKAGFKLEPTSDEFNKFLTNYKKNQGLWRDNKAKPKKSK